MKSILAPAFALAIAVATPTAFSADATEHDQHHPDAATSKSAPGGTKQAAKPSAAQKQNMEQMAKMDAQMKTMRDMHQKMMNARTPEERNALMAEHMKTMQDGMAMMKGMGGSMMGGSMMGGGMMGGQPSGKPGTPQGMQMQMDMMQKQMEMMQTMMQMMMDRMGPPAPAK